MSRTHRDSVFGAVAAVWDEPLGQEHLVACGAEVLSSPPWSRSSAAGGGATTSKSAGAGTADCELIDEPEKLELLHWEVEASDYGLDSSESTLLSVTR
jgi:hypothetical protein